MVTVSLTPSSTLSDSSTALALCMYPAVRAFMRICQSSQSQQGTCGFFGSGGYLLYEITEGQVRCDPNSS